MKISLTNINGTRRSRISTTILQLTRRNLRPHSVPRNLIIRRHNTNVRARIRYRTLHTLSRRPMLLKHILTQQRHRHRSILQSMASTFSSPLTLKPRSRISRITHRSQKHQPIMRRRPTHRRVILNTSHRPQQHRQTHTNVKGHRYPNAPSTNRTSRARPTKVNSGVNQRLINKLMTAHQPTSHDTTRRRHLRTIRNTKPIITHIRISQTQTPTRFHPITSTINRNVPSLNSNRQSGQIQ